MLEEAEEMVTDQVLRFWLCESSFVASFISEREREEGMISQNFRIIEGTLFSRNDTGIDINLYQCVQTLFWGCFG